jgi:hypothetical protein
LIKNCIDQEGEGTNPAKVVVVFRADLSVVGMMSTLMPATTHRQSGAPSSVSSEKPESCVTVPALLLAARP